MMEVVFVSFFNYGCIEIAKNHLESLKRNNIENYIAYVTDIESNIELTNCGYKSTLISYDDINQHFNKEKNDFGSDQFNLMCYVRYITINKLLKEGKAVWFLDVDTVVLYDLNKVFEEINKNIDIYFQSDINGLCCGCMLYLPNEKTIKLTEHMYQMTNTEINDQIMLNQILKQTQNFEYSIFSPNQFPNGLLYFLEPHSDIYFRNAQEEFKKSTEPVLFVHANWMLGVDTKINALKSKNLWFI